MGLFDEWSRPANWTAPKDLDIPFLKPQALPCMQSWVDVNPGERSGQRAVLQLPQLLLARPSKRVPAERAPRRLDVQAVGQASPAVVFWLFGDADSSWDSREGWESWAALSAGSWG